jgi:hypothetical protein
VCGVSGRRSPDDALLGVLDICKRIALRVVDYGGMHASNVTYLAFTICERQGSHLRRICILRIYHPVRIDSVSLSRSGHAGSDVRWDESELSVDEYGGRKRLGVPQELISDPYTPGVMSGSKGRGPL